MRVRTPPTRVAQHAHSLDRRSFKQGSIQKREGKLINRWKGADPRTGDVDDSCLRGAKQVAEGAGGFGKTHIWREDQQGFVLAFAELLGEGAAAGEGAKSNKDSYIRGFDVEPGALTINGAGRFPKTIATRNCAVFGAPAFRAPSAVGYAIGEGEVQGGAVGAGLAAGDDCETCGSPGALGVFRFCWLSQNG